MRYLVLLWVTWCMAVSTGCTFFPNLAEAKKTSVPASSSMICIASYATPGDAPPRWMKRLPNSPSPVQPWHVQTAEGTYWQDSGGDFYPEFLGATVESGDCSKALEEAFRAHLTLKMRLRGMGNMYRCTQQVHFDTTGFSNGGCDVDFNGMGRSRIVFVKEVSSPCFFFGASRAQNDFWGQIVNLEIDADVDGIAAQFGRDDFADPLNDCTIAVNVKNNAQTSGAKALVLNGIYSSRLNVIGNCGGSGTGDAAVSLNRCNMCSGFIAAGQGKRGLVFSNYTNGNSFSIDVEVLDTGIVQVDKTCAYNECTCGVIANLTEAIDNQKGGPLRIRNVMIGGVKHIFANPEASDASWGGCGVTIDDTGQNPTGFKPSAGPSETTWVMNKSAQPQWVAIQGSGSVEVRVRSWYDFSSEGTVVAYAAPCGFVLRPGEKVLCKKVENTSLSWTWRPLL